MAKDATMSALAALDSITEADLAELDKLLTDMRSQVKDLLAKRNVVAKLLGKPQHSHLGPRKPTIRKPAPSGTGTAAAPPKTADPEDENAAADPEIRSSDGDGKGAFAPKHSFGGQPTTYNTQMMDRRRKCADAIKKHGPLFTTKLAEKVGIPSGSITSVLNHEWFEKNVSGGIQLTHKGRIESVAS